MNTSPNASSGLPCGNIAAVRVGTAQRLDGNGRRTAYMKHAIDGAARIHALGIDGDTQANKRVHGGPEKAVYGYPASGYDGWRADFPEMAGQFVAGAMGENLVVTGQDEASLCIGDILAIGSARLQIAQIRQPCSTFAAVLGTPKVVRAMTRSRRCGWYYRVVEAGVVQAGDGHDVIERWNPRWTVARFAGVAGARSPDAADLAELSLLPGLTPDWQAWAMHALSKTQAAQSPPR